MLKNSPKWGKIKKQQCLAEQVFPVRRHAGLKTGFRARRQTEQSFRGGPAWRRPAFFRQYCAIPEVLHEKMFGFAAGLAGAVWVRRFPACGDGVPGGGGSGCFYGRPGPGNILGPAPAGSSDDRQLRRYLGRFRRGGYPGSCRQRRLDFLRSGSGGGGEPGDHLVPQLGTAAGGGAGFDPGQLQHRLQPGTAGDLRGGGPHRRLFRRGVH